MTREEVKLILKHNFPKAKITKLKEFAEGFNNLAYDVSIKNPNKNLVVKLLKCKFHKDIKIQSQKEQMIYKKILKKYPEFILPKMLFFDSSKSLISIPYQINEKIEGISLNEVFEKLKNKEEIFEQIGSIRSKLHSIKFRNFGNFDVNGKIRIPYSSTYEKESKEMKRIFKNLKIGKKVSKPFLEKQIQTWNKIKSKLTNDPKPCLCQGDPSFSNILLSIKNKKYYVKALIDFEFSHSGDPMSDVGRFWKSFNTRILPFLPNFIKGYSKYNKIPEDWKFRVFYYQWKQNLNSIEHIQNSSWKGLTQKENKLRRKKVTKINIEKAEEKSKELLTL